jgi:hypothetical protein
VSYAVWPSVLADFAPFLPKDLMFAYFLSASLYFLFSARRTISSFLISSLLLCGQSNKYCFSPEHFLVLRQGEGSLVDLFPVPLESDNRLKSDFVRSRSDVLLLPPPEKLSTV